MKRKELYLEKTDEELVTLTLQNNKYYLYLMERYEKKLLRYVMRISSLRKEDAEDVLQETFIKTYKNIDDFDVSLKFSSWIYRIAHNETINFLRKNRVLKNAINNAFNEGEVEELISEINQEEEFESKILKDRVQDVLNKMNEKYKMVLVLKFIEEKDYKEISDILQKPMGTVATLINRAKKQFRELAKKGGNNF